MCWNAQVSFNTWLIVVFGVIIGYVNKLLTVWGALFILSFGSIQLIEMFLWKNLDNKEMNNMWSKIGLGILFLQPLSSTLMLLDEKDKTWFPWLFVGCILLVIYMAYYAWSRKFNFETSIAPNGHLKWNWIAYPWWIIALWTMFLILPLYITGYKFSFFYTIFILVVSLALYVKDGTWGSMWCWFAAVSAFSLIIKAFWKSGFCQLQK